MTLQATIVGPSRAEPASGRAATPSSAARRYTTLVIADDRPIRRAAVAAWIGADASIEVVGIASRAEEAAAIIVDAQPATLLVACDHPTCGFLGVAARINRLSARTQVIVLSDEHNPRTCRAAAQCGASAHVCHTDHPDELLAAIRGRPASQPSRCVRLEEAITVPALSNREREVMIELAKGLSAKEAAAALGICAKTVDNHAQRFMRKLDLHSRADVVRFAVREGLVTV
ncbi:MAG: response regulator transcription factor [Phycisphaerae bacterium]|nr:response regulator transcription factor [Phycisphaerae bacterium]